MAEVIVSKPSIKVNNNAIAVKPNSVKFTEGYGETTVETASLGGDEVEIVVSENAEDQKGMVTFDLPSTIKNINAAKGWKRNIGGNVVELSGVNKTTGEKLSRVFRKQSITNNYEPALASGGSFSTVWEGAKPL